MRMGIDLEPYPAAGPRHFSDEPRLARLPADHTRHDGGQAEGRENVDEAALAHEISHRGTTIFRA